MENNKKSSEWPNYFPDGVPPKEAQEAEGKVFRLVKNIPPKKEDFRATIFDTTRKDILNESLLYGTLFHKNIDDSKVVRNKFKPFRDRRIVTGDLDKKMGMMLDTPTAIAKSHLTVWFRKNTTPHLAIKQEKN